MEIEFSNWNSISPRRNEFHFLTYAEEGFSPLNFWAQGLGITKDELVAFADSVNTLDEPGSLYPKAPVSAVPRRLLRDQSDPETLCLSIQEFLRVNALTIKSTKVVFDFGTPNLERYVRRAIEMALSSPDMSLIEELIVVD